MEAWLRPMLCGSADVVPTDPKWVLEGKLDGWRFVCHRRTDNVRAYAGRNGSRYSGQVPYIEADLIDLLPPDSAVDGELIGRRGWGDVQSVMTRGGGPHTPSRALPALLYVVFDVTRWAGEDLRSKPWSERREVLDRIGGGVLDGLSVNVAPYAPASEEAHEQMLKLGLEGSVCKRTDARYVNSRSNVWVKIKPQATAEAKVVGFKPGTAGSAFDGMVGALELEMLDSGARTRASGFDLATRKDITENPGRWLGTVVEIKHHGLSADGVPRHPQFLRRRDDRGAAAEVPVKRTVKEVRMSAPSPRNYGAMADTKLLRVMDELENGGDASERCLAKGFDPADDLVRVRQIATSRGLLDQSGPAAA